MESLQYPTGRFARKAGPLTPDERAVLRGRVRDLPCAAEAAVAGLDEARLDTPYREGGWTPRQIVHHLADSHLNAFVRFKLALTEDAPTIKPYRQEPWAESADVRSVAPGASLEILRGLHLRWSALLDALREEDWGRRLVHPEIGEIDLDFLLQMYAWHGHHHVAQITGLRERRGW